MEVLLALILVSAAADPSLAGGPGYEQPCRIRLYDETSNASVCADREHPVRQHMQHPVEHPVQYSGGHGVYEQGGHDVRYETRDQSQSAVRHSERRQTTRYATAGAASHPGGHRSANTSGHHAANASTHSATPRTVRLNDGFFYGSLTGGVERSSRTVVYGGGRSVVVINSGGGAGMASASASASARASATATVTVGGSHGHP